jgi:hypothetical protein
VGAVLVGVGVSLAGGQAAQAPSVPLARPLPSVTLSSAELVKFPGGYNPNRKGDFLADCNSPSYWIGNKLYLFNSWEQPWRSSGLDLFHLARGAPVDFDNQELKKLWIWMESIWQDEDGSLYGWFHNEWPNHCPPREGYIPGYPIIARIGALRSRVDGARWEDLGFVIQNSHQAITCDTEDYWYAGGAGDFFVIPDRKKAYFYFFFTNYSKFFSEQGLCLARMKYSDRNEPAGKVWIWYKGKWNEPALGGHATPIFPATVDLTRKEGQTFWGPVIHWNTSLEEYVMVVNRTLDTRWNTEGLYVSFNRDLDDPKGWSTPQKSMGRDQATHAGPEKTGNGWYVQVMGTEKGQTDKVAGRKVRLFVDGESRWEITFRKPGEK